MRPKFRHRLRHAVWGRDNMTVVQQPFNRLPELFGRVGPCVVIMTREAAGVPGMKLQPVLSQALHQRLATCNGVDGISCIKELAAVAPEACKDIDGCRTLAGIVWSCIATLVACTWVSVHPNVPDPSDGTIRLALHRVKLMLLAIIAPEIIVIWALRQRMVARKLGQDHYLPMIHGFFVSMGGFVESDGHTIHPITSHSIGTEIDAQTILKVHSGEIEDHSKGDEVSKGLAVLQTFWFIAQCGARARQHLPLTELEIITLAFAVLNIVIRVIWWHKPLDVRFPITITTLKNPSNPNTEQEPPSIAERPNPTIGDSTKEKPVPIRPIRRLGPIRRVFEYWLDSILMMFEGEEDNARIPKAAVRVPTLWAGRLDKWNRGVAATISIVLAMGFGGIHFAAWNASFPTEPEKLLWQVAAVLVVAIPFFLFLGATMVLKRGKITAFYHNIVFNLVIPLGAFAYVMARVILMVLPFVTLRSLPPEALRDVEWIKFVPHIG